MQWGLGWLAHFLLPKIYAAKNNFKFMELFWLWIFIPFSFNSYKTVIFFLFLALRSLIFRLYGAGHSLCKTNPNACIVLKRSTCLHSVNWKVQRLREAGLCVLFDPMVTLKARFLVILQYNCSYIHCTYMHWKFHSFSENLFT